MTPAELDALEALEREACTDERARIRLDAAAWRLIAALREAWRERDEATRERDHLQKFLAEAELALEDARAEAKMWQLMVRKP